MRDIELGLVQAIAIYIGSPPDCLCMMIIKENMFNSFVTITETTLLFQFILLRLFFVRVTPCWRYQRKS